MEVEMADYSSQMVVPEIDSTPNDLVLCFVKEKWFCLVIFTVCFPHLYKVWSFGSHLAVF